MRLTPENTQLAGIVADGDHTLYIRVLRDSDNDHKFTETDEVVILRVDLAQPAEGRPILDDEARKRVQSIIEAK